MPKQKIALIIGVVVVIAAVVIGVGYWSPKDVEVEYALTAVRDGTFTGVVPPLDRDIQISGDMPEAAKVVLRQKVADTLKELRSVPYDGNTWMDLALEYHTGNDYEGARMVWEFIVSQPPTNVTALGNLGRLYHFDLKDFPKAEEYLLKAVAANPARSEAYYDLFDLYRYSYKKNTSAAADIMKTAAKQFPDDSGIPAGLGAYYRELGKTGLARTYFEQALVVARAKNDLTQIDGLTRELSSLP